MSKASASRFVTLDELCEILTISKATWYKQQRQGIFPAPLRTSGGRLVFDESLVEQCKTVVRTRTGLNGEPVIFQARKRKQAAATPSLKTSSAGTHQDTIRALASLGLTATPEDIEQTSKDLPAGLPEPERLRQLFLALRKQG